MEWEEGGDLGEAWGTRAARRVVRGVRVGARLFHNKRRGIKEEGEHFLTSIVSHDLGSLMTSSSRVEHRASRPIIMLDIRHARGYQRERLGVL